MRAKFGSVPMAGSKKVSFNFIIGLGVRSLANASRARQFNPLNPPGVGWVPLPQTNMAAVVGRARSCAVVRGRACVVGHAWSCVVVRGSAWSCVVVRGRARSCAVVRYLDSLYRPGLFLAWFILFTQTIDDYYLCADHFRRLLLLSLHGLHNMNTAMLLIFSRMRTYAG